jgi:hypothetical protein
MPLDEAVDLAEVLEVQPSSLRSDEVKVLATDFSGKFNSHSAIVPPCPAPPKSVIPGYNWWLDGCNASGCILCLCVSLSSRNVSSGIRGKIEKNGGCFEVKFSGFYTIRNAFACRISISKKVETKMIILVTHVMRKSI